MKKYLILLVLAVIITSCKKDILDPQDIIDPIETDTTTQTFEWQTDEITYDYDRSDSCSYEINQQFSDGLNEFAVRMFKDIYNDNNTENVIISPFSINAALGMLFPGSNSTNRDQIKTVLNLDGMSDEDVYNNYKLMFDSYRGFDEDVDITVANSTWFDQSVTPNENAENQLIDYFYADIFNVELLESEDMINSWVDFYTNGLIPEIYNDLGINPYTAMVLINTLCFNGSWTYQFDVEDTEPGSFTNKSGQDVTVDYMHSRGLDLKYYFSDTINAVRLPYGREQTAMYLLINPNAEADALPTWFTNEQWQTMSEEFELIPEEYWEFWDGIYIPKFSLNYDVKFTDYLTNWGIPVEYTEFCSESLILENAVHKCTITINESGTEAAAVTGFTFTWGPPPDIEYNHPFYFMIVDERNSIILFQGIVNEL